jgi:hypothetical protein
MTQADRMRAAFKGEGADSLPWAPRLDLWYTANRMAGTLPRGLEDAPIIAVMDELRCGYHAVIPDFRLHSGPDGDAHVGLGFYNARWMPVRVELHGLRWETRRDGQDTITEYHTPHGTIETRIRLDEAMIRSGITLPHVSRRAFRGAGDYRALRHVFENAEPVSNCPGFSEFMDLVGDRGVAFGYACPAASPMHYLLHVLVPFDLFYYEAFDHPMELAELAGAVGGFMRRLLDVAVESPAEAVFWGGNFDASLTPPPFFVESIVPWAREAASVIHGAGKLFLAHTDGENRGLLDAYLDCGIDIADSVCPAPMTSLGFREVRKAFGERVTIMGGIPSVALLPDSMPDSAFGEFLDSFFEDVRDGRRLVLGISDTTPPGANFERLREITRRVEAFGPVPSRARLAS